MFEPNNLMDQEDPNSIIESLIGESSLPEIQEEEEPYDHYENLAFSTDESVLSTLSNHLLEEIQSDLDARSEWESACNTANTYLGFKVEDSKSEPFVNACAAFDSNLAKALVRAYSTARAELFPADGPCKVQILGTPNEQIEDAGERIKLFMNYYLTQVDREYYPDSELLLMYAIFFGSAFRQVYQDPILKRPVSRTIKPQDFIVNPSTPSLMSSDRMTKVFYLNKKEIILRERSRDFLKTDLLKHGDVEDEPSRITQTIQNIEGIKPDNSENKSLFKYYEVHTNLTDSELKLYEDNQSEPEEEEEAPLQLEDLRFEDRDAEFDDFQDEIGFRGDIIAFKDEDQNEDDDEYDDHELPKPYIITICESNKKIVSIKRNWEENSQTFEKREFFVNWYYLQGFGIYGIGLVHLMGSNAIVLTSVLRQLIDSGTLKNFPGGMKTADLRSDNNDINPGPGVWIEVQTGNRPLQDCIMPMPYAEPSQVLAALRKELAAETEELAATVETSIPENGGVNMPVGTTLALLEVKSKIQSSVLRSFHVSLGNELRLLYNIFGQNLTDEPYPFLVPGKEVSIMKKDFSDKVNIVPSSDPNVLTTTHRLLRNQALIQLASQFPQYYDMREIQSRMLHTMNVDQIDKILPPPPKPIPLDPTTENMMAMSGKPLIAVSFQDNKSHLIVHGKGKMEALQFNNLPAYMSIISHEQEHKALDALSELIKQFSMESQQLQQKMAETELQAFQNPMMAQQLQASAQQQISQFQQKESQIMQWSKMTAQQLLTIPEIQNAVSMGDAKEIMAQQEAAKNQPQQGIDPNVVLMVQKDKEIAALKHQEEEQKIELDAYKTQLKFEEAKLKDERDRDLSSDKNDLTLEIAQMKERNSLNAKQFRRKEDEKL